MSRTTDTTIKPHRAKRTGITVAAAAASAALVLGACGSSGGTKGSSNTTSPVTASQTTATTAAQPSGATKTGGTVKWAEAPAATPDYIFPLAPFADFSVANLSQFQELMYRPLYWFGTDGSPTVDFTKSVGAKPVWSNGDKTVSVTLDPYTWSNGEKVDARDVLFWMNLLDAEKTQWADYTPGLFPDNVKSITMPKGPTGNVVTFKLNRSYNPSWFLYNELSQITPLPIAWDVTAAGSAPSPTAKNLPDTTAKGAAKVFTYLDSQSKKLTSYIGSPLWSVVDGPWSLKEFSTQGNVTFVPNTKYTGTDKPKLASFVEVPYTTDTSEFDAVESSSSNIQVGYVPAQDLSKLKTVEGSSYKGLVAYPFAFNYMPFDFKSPTAGPLFKQLYIRQALQDLVDQKGWIKAYYEGLAAPTYGPVPVEPPNPFADAVEKGNPYPFSISAATSLLTSHGWTVKKGGTSTCAVPSKCGAGIKAGQGLTFSLNLASGSVPLTDSIQDFKSVAAQAGIQINVLTQSFDTVIGGDTPKSTSWDIGNWGGGWVYAPDYYPSGESLFQTGAGSNAGSYSDPTADKLIKATTQAPEAKSQSTLNAYQNYLAKQVPVLYQPAAATEDLIATDLGGSVLHPNAFDNLDPEGWYYVGK